MQRVVPERAAPSLNRESEQDHPFFEQLWVGSHVLATQREHSRPVEAKLKGGVHAQDYDYPVVAVLSGHVRCCKCAIATGLLLPIWL